jgi:hypothetical protein
MNVKTRDPAGLPKPTCIFFKTWSLISVTKGRILFLQYPFADHHRSGIRPGLTVGWRGARMSLSRLHIPRDLCGLSRYSRVIRPGQRLGWSR